jgi:microcin C transport system substrate-binding protein
MAIGSVMVAVALSGPLAAADGGQTKHHGFSLIGPVKHGPDYKHFDWVNPDAPKGGSVRLYAQGTFDSLNQFAIKGQPAAGIGLIYDQLFSSSPDEPTAEYGLIAEWMSFPDDYSSVTFRLRPEAKWHDGTPITVEDVIFSMDAVKAANPRFGAYWKNVAKAEKTGDREVTFTFDSKMNRELPHIVGELTVLPKHWWTAKGADGEPRDLGKGTSEIPLGSGPYKVKSIDMTRGVTYQRVPDYWARDLPVAKGQWNFDEVRFTYFRDRTPAFEEFKAGKIDVWNENRASAWASQYNFDAVKTGQVKKETLPQERLASMQAFVMNTRRAKFADPRVRRALNLVYNFEAANEQLFYGQYVRTGSFFENSDLAAKGLPTGAELEILNSVKDQVPPEVFTTEWRNPVNTKETRRANLGEATKLFAAAGWTAKNGVLVNAGGEEFNVEFLIEGDDFKRIILPYIEDLKLIGVKASVRLVDPPQYKAREDTFDFDIIIDTFGQSISPGNEQRDFWGSAMAEKNGSRNTIGVKSPAIDKLIDRIVFSKDRAELIAATRALDRVLLWNHFVVPQWHYPYERIATWDMFGRPAKLPSQNSSLLRTWWVDAAKQAALPARSN